MCDVDFVRIDIPGLPPTVNARKVLVRGVPMNRKSVARFQRTAGQCGLAAMARAGHRPVFTAPVVAVVDFVVGAHRRRDVDGSLKDVLDGLQGTVYRNDRQIVQLQSRRQRAPKVGPLWQETTIVYVADAGTDADAAMAALLRATSVDAHTAEASL